MNTPEGRSRVNSYHAADGWGLIIHAFFCAGNVTNRKHWIVWAECITITVANSARKVWISLYSYYIRSRSFILTISNPRRSLLRSDINNIRNSYPKLIN
jgi:hypothetical protein